MIEIRKTEIAELGILMELFEQGKRIMRKSGNMKQWTGGYPDEELVKKDIENGNSYVCLDEEQNIVGTFTFIQGNDPTYARITKEPGVTTRVPTASSTAWQARNKAKEWHPPACNGATARFPTYGQTRTATTISCNISSKSTASNIAASYTCRMETNGWPFRSYSNGTRTNSYGPAAAVFLLQLLHGCSGEILFHESQRWLSVRVSVPKKKENSSICSSKIRSFVSSIRL